MSKAKIIRTNSANADFRILVVLLDQDLAIRDGDEHAFYAKFNQIDTIAHAVVAYRDDYAVGCGAIKLYADRIAEIKRMYGRPEFRGQGIAGEILRKLESWGIELGFAEAILETGKKQPEALRLYQKSGYQVIPNYGQYDGIENSVCMRKVITSMP